MKCAVIDIGTNSIKMSVGELNERGNLIILSETSVITRLGENVDRTGELDPAAQDRSAAAIRNFINQALDMSASKCRIFATSAVRDARNGRQFIDRVHSDTGIRPEIFSEEDECRFSYLAAAQDPALNPDRTDIAVMDSGGGSTEISFGSGDELTFCQSIKVGAVRVTERALHSDPPTPSELTEASRMIDSAILHSIGHRGSQILVGIGGSVINLARIIERVHPGETSSIHGLIMTPQDITDTFYKLSRMTCEQRRHLTGLDPQRADIIVAGVLIISRTMAALGSSQLRVSIHGPRHAILRSMLQSTN